MPDQYFAVKLVGNRVSAADLEWAIEESETLGGQGVRAVAAPVGLKLYNKLLATGVIEVIEPDE